MKNVFFSASVILLIFLTACKQHSAENNNSTQDDVQIGVLDTREEKLVKKASIDIKVADARTAAKQISEFTNEVGGQIMNHTFELNPIDSKQIKKSEDSLLVVSSFSPMVHLSVRVPSDSLANFLSIIQDENELVSRMEYDVQDMTMNFRENELRNELRQKYLNKEGSSKSFTDSLALATADDAVTHQINNALIDKQVAYSNVELGISQSPFIRKTMIANSDLSAYKPGVALRFSEAFQSGADGFITLLIALSHLWLIFVFALIGALGYFYYKLQRKQKLLIISNQHK